MIEKNIKSNTYRILSLAVLGLLALSLVATIVISALPREASANDRAGFYRGYNDPEARREHRSFDNPVPVVSSITPDSANLVSGGRTITITGSGFIPGSVTRIDGSPRASTFIDESHLLIHLNSGDMSGASGKYINVWNPAPGGGFSNSAFFAIAGLGAPTTVSYNAPVVGPGSALGASRSTAGSVAGASKDAEEKDANALLASAIYGSEGSFLPSGLMQWVIVAILVLLAVIIVRKLYFEKKFHAEPLKHA
jgi:hypothetical protein